MLLLSKFQWYESLRPKDPDDIFVISEEMDALMADGDTDAPATPAAPQNPEQLSDNEP
jgi:hypothetical protein